MMLCHCQVSTTACISARGGLIENSLELIKSPRRPYTIQMYHYIKILTNVVCVFWSMNKIFLLLPIPIKTSKLSSGIICSSPQSRETFPLNPSDYTAGIQKKNRYRNFYLTNFCIFLPRFHCIYHHHHRVLHSAPL